MHSRTRTYIAGDWTGDKDAIQQLYNWNNSNYWNLSFSDAHDLTQARDSSLNCSIKKSLLERLNASKTFILIVGNETANLKAGSCQYCQSYNSWNSYCARNGYSIDYRSYIEYECEKAYEAYINREMKIVVLYNSNYVDRNKCPKILRYVGNHVSMVASQSFYGEKSWNYYPVYNAINY